MTAPWQVIPLCLPTGCLLLHSTLPALESGSKGEGHKCHMVDLERITRPKTGYQAFYIFRCSVLNGDFVVLQHMVCADNASSINWQLRY